MVSEWIKATLWKRDPHRKNGSMHSGEVYGTFDKVWRPTNQVTIISIASRCTEIYSPWITCIVSNNYSLYIDWVSKNEKQNLPPVVFSKKAVLKTFTVFTGKQMYWSLFLIKLQAFFKKILQHRFFSCKCGEIFKNIHFEEHLRTAASVKAYFFDSAQIFFTY